MKAGTLASMMMSPANFYENEENITNFQEMYSRTLMQVAMYLRYLLKAANFLHCYINFFRLCDEGTVTIFAF